MPTRGHLSITSRFITISLKSLPASHTTSTSNLSKISTIATNWDSIKIWKCDTTLIMTSLTRCEWGSVCPTWSSHSSSTPTTSARSSPRSADSSPSSRSSSSSSGTTSGSSRNTSSGALPTTFSVVLAGSCLLLRRPGNLCRKSLVFLQTRPSIQTPRSRGSKRCSTLAD